MTNAQFAEIFRKRTKNYVLRCVNLYRSLPENQELAKIFGKQFIRAASSTGANYRAACRARSANEFHSKISIVVEECDESCFWMEMIIETGLLPAERVNDLLKEGYEILATAASARHNVRRTKRG